MLLMQRNIDVIFSLKLNVSIAVNVAASVERESCATASTTKIFSKPFCICNINHCIFTNKICTHTHTHTESGTHSHTHIALLV